MRTHTVEEIEIPSTIADENARDFIDAVDARNSVEAAAYGTTELSMAAVELLPGWQDQKNTPIRMFGVRVDGVIVARGILETSPEGVQSDVAWLTVEVPPEFRGTGMGSALADHLEALAVERGIRRLITYAVSSDSPGARLESPTGFGSVPRDNDEVRFLLQRGYRLEQVVRGSRLPLPIDPLELEAQLSAARERSGADYRVHTWIAHTPPEWLEDVALLLTRMSTDEPQGELDQPEEVWTAERLAQEEQRQESSPRSNLVAAVEHVPSGTIVGYSDLGVPAEVARSCGQRDTIVLGEHRGHRLGMLLKLANLDHLQRERPGHPSVMTFNAEENRHMLDVNEAVGFEPIGYEGAWKKVL